MQQQTAYVAPYLEAFDAFQGKRASGDPAYVRARRQEAIERFGALGFPTARRGNEAWKYTDVGPLARIPFQLADPHGSAQLKPGQLRNVAFGNAGWPKLVFVDGIYSEDLSNLPGTYNGVTICNLAEAMAYRSEVVEEHLGRLASLDENGFTALNSAFVHDGAFVHVSKDYEVELPLLIINLSSGKQPDSVSHPRALIVAEEGADAMVVEMHLALKGSRYFTNAVTEVVASPGATVHHFRVQRQSNQAYHIATIKAEVGRGSCFDSAAVDLGSALARNNLGVTMVGEEGFAELNGLYLVGNAQHVDNEVIIDHTAPHTKSRELYKGILDGKSRSVFHGSIIVRKGAQKVNASQADKNLLLSEQAEADTKPAFWIYADDVKCGHGAANGQLDESALFYLQARGIDRATARTMLVRAFAREIIQLIDLAPLRTYLDRQVMKAIPQLQSGAA